MAYVADPSLHAIHTVELASARVLATSPVAGAPRQLLVLGDGRVAATIEDEARLDVFEPGRALSDGLAQRCSRETPRLPWGLAEDESGATVVVSSGWDAALTLFDGATLQPRRVSALPRAPRSVIVR
ncbi:MAG TPA: cytochrome C peroxidase, partial [Polyangiaceae bacterium]|nr:cytochrome C peroxidase [Polyangiaceae bacterium]